MKLLTTNDFLDKAIAEAKKKAEYHRIKSRNAIGMDMKITAETLFDPKLKPKWDAHFKKSSNQMVQEMDLHMNAQIHYENVARDLKNIQMFHNRI